MLKRASLYILALPGLVFAHHGGAEYYLQKTVVYHGKLTSVDMINPHSWIYFDVAGQDGKTEHHRCEMRSVHVLRRSGWTKERFPIGQQVTIEASPNRNDPLSCYLQTIVSADGTRMDRYGQYIAAANGGVQEVRGPIVATKADRPLRRPTGELNITGDWAPVQLVMVNPKGTGGGLVPLDTLPDIQPGERQAGGGRGRGTPAGPRLYGGTELTEAGEKAARISNAKIFRASTVRPPALSSTGPLTAPSTASRRTRTPSRSNTGNRSQAHHLHDAKDHPANIRPTRAGHSIGRWEGDTLVVDTVGFLPGWLNTPVANSDKLHVVERFTLDTGKMALTRAYTAEDPVYLKGQYKKGRTPSSLPTRRSTPASAKS